MNREGQSDREQETTANTPEPMFRIENPDRPTFRPDPTLIDIKDNPGELEATQEVLNAFDRQMARQRETVSTNQLLKQRPSQPPQQKQPLRERVSGKIAQIRQSLKGFK